MISRKDPYTMAEMTLPAGLADEIEALLYRSRRAALFEAWAAAREAEGALPLLSRFRRYRLRSPADPAARATELRQLAAAAMAQDEAAPLRTWLSRVRDWPGLYALGAAL
ncbi:MAG: hypothetical protein J0M20_15280, partial [Burkholderiales bacterium]|nr:hypothetical protein [Burkholderiales bacterium]